MAGITIEDKITGSYLTAAEFNQLLEALKDGSRTINTAALFAPKVKTTDDGGVAVLLTNKSGSESIKGYLVKCSSSTDNAVENCGIEVPDAFGVFLDSGIADGAEAWVVVTGIASVYFSGSTTRGHLARVGFSVDTGEVASQAISEPYPSSPFATDKHFAEIGHVLESRVGAGLAKCVLHFN